MLTKKQTEVIECIKTENPKILICSGAKRAGKTFLLILAFAGHAAKFKNCGVKFIIAGTDQAAIRRNILDDLESLVGHEIKLDKSNSFNLFGNTVYCLGGKNSDAWKNARGFTAAGALLNEATALNDRFVKECISRCSYKGARIFIDTNPENPNHTIKTDYIDHDGERLKTGRINVRAFNFTLFDNTTLDPEYVESIIKSTPEGMFSDRDIFGRWVSAEGIVYRDFNNDYYISDDKIENVTFVKYIAGVDWGYEHYGAIVVVGITADRKYILVEEYADRHREIDYWVNIANTIKNKYGNIIFYCDSARPEHIARFRREGVHAVNANKCVLSGIETIAGLYKMHRLCISENVKRFKEEISQYAWNSNTGEPIKTFDDVQDALRYAIYTYAETINKANRKGIQLLSEVL